MTPRQKVFFAKLEKLVQIGSFFLTKLAF